MSASTRGWRSGRWILGLLIGLAGVRSEAAQPLDEDGPAEPPPCNKVGKKLPNGRTYRLQGRMQQDCLQTPYGAVLNLPGYKVEILANFGLVKKCPTLPSTQYPTVIGSTTTRSDGTYSFSITSAALNGSAPEHYDITGVFVGVNLREPGTNTIVGTKFTTWSHTATATLNYTITDDCPADRLSEPKADEPVWRVQLRLITSGASNADTEDSIDIRLNPRNDTWIDYARDDFERNDDFTYDLLPIEIGQRSDINQIVITKEGMDAWAIRRFQLLVNEVVMYDETFPGQGLWLDGDPGFSPEYVVDYYTLRNNAAWEAWEPPPLSEALLISHADLLKRLEGMLGHLAHLGGAEMEGEHLYGAAVEVEQVDSQTLEVDFDLTAPVDDWDDAEVDIDFRVRFSCDDSEPPIELKNLHVSVDSFLDFFSHSDDLAKSKLRLQITQNFEKFVNRLYAGSASGRCPCVDEVLEDGGLRIFGVRSCPVTDDGGSGGGGTIPPITGGTTGTLDGGIGGGSTGGRNLGTLGTSSTATRR